MDPRFRGFSASVNGIQMENQSISVFLDHNVNNGPKFHNPCTDQKLENGNSLHNSYIENKYNGLESLPDDSLSRNITSTSSHGVEDDYDEDCDSSDAILSYINKMLMEEDMEDKTCMLQESLELRAKEKSFYEVIGDKYPPLPENTGAYIFQNGETPDDSISGNRQNSSSGGTDVGDYLVNVNECIFQVQSLDAQNASDTLLSTENNANTVLDQFFDSPMSTLQSSDMHNEIQSIWNFQKGVEDANKFLPSGDKLFQNVESSTLDEGEYLLTGLTGRRNRIGEDVDLEEDKSRKQAVICTDSTVRSEEFDIILLNSTGKGEAELRAYSTKLQHATSKNMQHNGGKNRGKKWNRKKDVVDLSTLLINCAQAAASDDCRSASELLQKIRQHSSPYGDGNQRLAHCFADALEARLAGTGSQIYKGLVSKFGSAADYLKAYHLFLASCPFKRMSNFASNKTIMIKAEKATRVHIIDFGILNGFQWPTFIQRLAARDGGPPKLRITGIEFPQPGFRPAERIEETGRRLADYALTFHVPFEYNAIAKNWETIRIEDLKIEKDELLVVNSVPF